MGNKSLNPKHNSNSNQNNQFWIKSNHFNQTKNRWSEPSIFSAIDANDCQRIRQLIKNGHNINKRDGNGLTALHLAAINGNEQCLQLLIEFGPLLKCCPLRQTALHFAAQNGNKNMINILIDYGSVVNTKDMMGSTPLASAVEVNNSETAVALLDRGAQLEPCVCVCALQNGFTDLFIQLLNFRPNIIESIDLKEFRFTRLTATGLKVLYFAGFRFDSELLARIQPLDWSDFYLRGQIRLQPQHYNRDQDFRAFEVFTEWFETREQPISLKCLSRIAFRTASNQTNLQLVLNQSNIPKIIKQYLLLNDIFE